MVSIYCFIVTLRFYDNTKLPPSTICGSLNVMQFDIWVLDYDAMSYLDHSPITVNKAAEVEKRN